MTTREEINMMVKVAQATQGSYMDIPAWKRLEDSTRMFENEKKWIRDNGYDKGKITVDTSTWDKDIAANKKKQDIIKRQWEQRQQQQRQQNIVRNMNGRQMIDATGRMPVAGRSIGSGYTGNEIRHGGINPSPISGMKNSYVGNDANGNALYDDGNGKKTYDQLGSTQMMKKWLDAGDVDRGWGPGSAQWKDYVRNSNSRSSLYLPNNRKEYTYAGSQTRPAQIAQTQAGQVADSKNSINEFGGPVNDMGVEGTRLCPSCGGTGHV